MRQCAIGRQPKVAGILTHMSELLLEVGCEELPATFVRKAYTDLLASLTAALEDAGILVSPGTVFGTPRRLIVSFPDLKDRQEDVTKDQRGPALKAAYGEDGNPTPALLGFCRSQGIEPSALRKDDQYVWFTRTIEGKPTSELLQEILPKAIRGLAFDKTMRWGASRMRFARPIRWILASLGGVTVPFEIEGVAAASVSRGHRFYAPESFVATSLDALIKGLRERKVEPDPEVRRKQIVDGAKSVAEGEPQMAEALIEENVFLTEWPTAIQGHFKESFQNLPQPVLITAMAKHEKMFPIRDQAGELTNRFVFIRNSGEDDSVRKGCEWVLNARFNDAQFFYSDDQKHSLEYFLEKTSGILFQEKLGSVRQRADRLAALAEKVAEKTGADAEEAEYARKAGLFAKADLSTGLVSELASLQGIVGGEYAKKEGWPEPVCSAMASHYDLSKNPSPDCPGARTAVRVTIADQLDKLAGYLGQGLEPSGSSDPFGLRRATTILIEAAWDWKEAMPSYRSLLDIALDLYVEQGVALDKDKAQNALSTVFASRYSAMLPDARHDILEGSLLADATSPRRVRLHVNSLSILAADVAFVQTATRPLNIVAAAEKKGVHFVSVHALQAVDAGSLDSSEGATLLEALKSTDAPLDTAVEAEDAQAVANHLRTLSAPINEFFNSTMVMVEDEATRTARLTLLQAASVQLLKAGDFTKIVIEG